MHATPLLQSAQDFLTESLANLSSRRLKFAILHAITAVELVLKERLVRLHPALIYQNIDTKTPKERTVSLSSLPQRLSNLGMPLDSTRVRQIQKIAEWRHQIVHHTVELDNHSAGYQLAQLLDFLAAYMRANLATPLETFLPKELYREAQTLLSDWQVAVKDAQNGATREGNVLPDNCPRCRSTHVMTLRGDAGAVRCHLCAAALYRCDHCDGCGRQTFVDYLAFRGQNYCDECIDAAGDRYLEFLIDLERGK